MAEGITKKILEGSLVLRHVLRGSYCSNRQLHVSNNPDTGNSRCQPGAAIRDY